MRDLLEEVVIGGRGLKRRDLQILRMLAQGLKPKEIAPVVYLSQRTVENLLSTDEYGIFTKINARNQGQAISWFVGIFGNPLDDRGTIPSSSLDRHDFLSSQVEHITKIRLQGNPPLANEIAREWSQLLRAAREPLTVEEKEYRRLGQILGRVLLEQGWTYAQTLLADDDFLERTRRIHKEVVFLARECADFELLGLANLQLGCAYYTMRRYQEALGWLSKASQYSIDVNSSLQLQRVRAVSFAYMGAQRDFETARFAVEELIEAGNARVGEIVQALEGLGRAQGLLGSPLGFETLDKAQGLYDNNIEGGDEAEPMLAVMLGRSKLVAAHHLAPKEYALLERIGTEGLSLTDRARAHRFRRIEHQMRQLLDKTLN